MPTISMFYGILIRMFFTTQINTISRIYTRNIRDRLRYTLSRIRKPFPIRGLDQ